MPNKSLDALAFGQPSNPKLNIHDFFVSGISITEIRNRENLARFKAKYAVELGNRFVSSLE